MRNTSCWRYLHVRGVLRAPRGGGGGGGAGAPSLGEVLDGAGLSQYTDKFLAEDIDLDAFGQVQRKGVLLAAFLAAWGVN